MGPPLMPPLIPSPVPPLVCSGCHGPSPVPPPHAQAAMGPPDYMQPLLGCNMSVSAFIYMEEVTSCSRFIVGGLLKLGNGLPTASSMGTHSIT